MGFIWGFYDGLDQQLYLQKIASKSRDACQGLEMSLKSRDWTCKSTVETSRRVLKTGDGRLFFFKTSHATQHFYFSCWHTTQTQIHLCARKSFIHLVCSSGGWVYPQCLPKLVVNKRGKTGSKDRILSRAQTHTHARRHKHGLACTDSIKEDACIICVCVWMFTVTVASSCHFTCEQFQAVTSQWLQQADVLLTWITNHLLLLRLPSSLSSLSRDACLMKMLVLQSLG